jgi:hypothetical protein
MASVEGIEEGTEGQIGGIIDIGCLFSIQNGGH